jgi:hypothetical protein
MKEIVERFGMVYCPNCIISSWDEDRGVMIYKWPELSTDNTRIYFLNADRDGSRLADDVFMVLGMKDETWVSFTVTADAMNNESAAKDFCKHQLEYLFSRYEKETYKS